ncbi:right-handed parallel beta-helix repeat-containing protein [Nocardioides daphniae]|uniref:Right-handed parallel beta-helix repeat-containing protein n=1 Tax=Nocardioides daphniae TaxID=402297 RepID=A0A4P7U7Z3_9ACTN|nr:right-handed parallel beta-helix repeat-containing protein [Nocardioides daphniae]QCC76303.1 right-handed parallel beta-helix repeat-containing protein [Nocardioides daphniae]GGD08165.1 hypothetical protein GCM10007231_03670 [Nocardioides daphniae]
MRGALAALALVLAPVLALGPAVAVPVPSAEAKPRTLRVGPDRALTTPSAAAAVARDGDTVLIDAGVYSGDVATWPQDDLTLRSVRSGKAVRAHLKAAGRHAQGKATWVISGDRVRVEGIEFSGSVVPDRNGAGIRSEGTDLVVVRSWFHHNQMGLLTVADDRSDIVVRDSRFFRNGAGDGLSHNLYVGAVRSLTVTGSWLWGASVGHQLKSRAARTTLLANRFDDADGTGSYSVDLPNGGDALLVGNLVVQGPRSQNTGLVSYGAERLTHSSRRLRLVNNTFVNRQQVGTYLRLAAGSGAVLRNNLFHGPGALADRPVDARANRRVGPRAFLAAGRGNFRLRKGSVAINRGVAVGRGARARWEYAHPAHRVRRPVKGRVDLGAYERR